jgi:hypothetical protein
MSDRDISAGFAYFPNMISISHHPLRGKKGSESESVFSEERCIDEKVPYTGSRIYPLGEDASSERTEIGI